MDKKLVFGGQALIEGILMKSPNFYAIAVRNSDGKIVMKHGKHQFLSIKHKILNIPFLRGGLILFETMILGIKALSFSANASQGEEEEKLGAWEIAITLVISMLFALFLFKLLPLLGANFLASQLGGNNFLFNLADGLIKLTILLLYLFLIGKMKDIRTMFQYHGAEHMAVNCYEAGKPLDVKHCSKFTTINGRCGTSFILFTILASVFVYLVIPFDTSFWMKYLYRILLLPVIGGFSYEIIKLSFRFPDNKFLTALLSPGLGTQRITTKRPDKKQLEVSLTALRKVLSLEKAFLSRPRAPRKRLSRKRIAV